MKNLTDRFVKFILFFFRLTLEVLPLLFIIYVYFDEELPQPKQFFDREIPQSAIILDQEGEELYRFYNSEDRIYVNIEDVPEQIKWSIIASEDKNFYQHTGTDTKAIIRCIIKTTQYYLSNGETSHVCGASTISQQLIKNTILKEIYPDEIYTKSLPRKIKEIILAAKLENSYSKDEILEMYINEVPMGGVLHGLQAASRKYFDKNLDKLTLSESAFLAGMIQAPSYYSPNNSEITTETQEERRDYVLSQLEKMGKVKTEEIDKAGEEKLVFNKDINLVKAPWFVLYTREQVINKFGIKTFEESGLSVHTSLNYKMESIAEHVVKSFRDEIQTKYNAYNSSLVAVDVKTGNILAFVGSSDFNNTDDKRVDGNNYVITNPRQYGGLLTPFTLATAVKEGYGPWLLTPDIANLSLSPYYPNYDGKYNGLMTFRKAIVTSRTLPLAYTSNLLGTNKIDEMQRELGIESNKRENANDYLSSIGQNEVSLLELSQAYSTIANLGTKVPLTTIVDIFNHQGNSLYPENTDTTKVLTESESYLVNYTLCDLGNHNDRLFNDLYKINTDNGKYTLCGKTGISDDPRDYSAILYTPEIVIGVWVGNSNNEELNLTYSTNPALEIGREYAQKLYENSLLNTTTFKEPENVIGGLVCTDSGNLVENSNSCLAENTIYLKNKKPNTDSRRNYYTCNSNPLKICAPAELNDAIRKKVVTMKVYLNKNIENKKEENAYKEYLEQNGYRLNAEIEYTRCDFPDNSMERLYVTNSPMNQTLTMNDNIVFSGTINNPERYSTLLLFAIPYKQTNIAGVTVIQEQIPDLDVVHFSYTVPVSQFLKPGIYNIWIEATHKDPNKRVVYPIDFETNSILTVVE